MASRCKLFIGYHRSRPNRSRPPRGEGEREGRRARNHLAAWPPFRTARGRNALQFSKGLGMSLLFALGTAGSRPRRGYSVLDLVGAVVADLHPGNGLSRGKRRQPRKIRGKLAANGKMGAQQARDGRGAPRGACAGPTPAQAASPAMRRAGIEKLGQVNAPGRAGRPSERWTRRRGGRQCFHRTTWCSAGTRA